MRIGIVLPSVPAYSETFFINKIKGLEKSGFSVVVLTNNSSKVASHTLRIKVAPKLKGNKFIITLTSIYILFISFLFNFRRSKNLYLCDKKDSVRFSQRIKNIISNYHILTEDLDWLHFGFGTTVFNKENVAKVIGAKMAISFRGFDIGVYPLKNPNCYLKIWKKIDRIHVISDDIEDLVYKNGFDEESKIIKITPAIDKSFFNYDKVYHLSKENKFITVSRLHWKKGLVYTLEALSNLKKKGMHFHYTIIGDGPDLERLQFAVYQLNLVENVTFKGKIEHKQIKYELNSADIYLQYSIQEGFCNSVLEAQAAGLLCLVSNGEGLSENIINNETGYVVPKCNPIKFANKIYEVVDYSTDKKNSVIKNARERVSKYFNIEKQEQEFISFYSE